MYSFAIVVLLLFTGAGAYGQHLNASYRLAVGSADQVISDGQVRLYAAGRAGVEAIELGRIRDRNVTLRFGPEMIPESFQIPDHPAAVFVAVDAGDGRWFRTAPFPAGNYNELAGSVEIGKYFAGSPSPFRASFEDLGELDQSTGNVPLLVLDDYVDRRITLRNLEGSPAAGQFVRVEVLTWYGNNCGVNRRIAALGEFYTDDQGSFLVRAPLVPLALGVTWITPFSGSGRWPKFALRGHATTPAEQDVELSARWGRPAPAVVTIRVMDSEFNPLSGYRAVWSGLPPCGTYANTYGPSGVDGEIQMDVSIAMTSWIEILKPGSDETLRHLTDDEIDRLKQYGELPIVIQGPE